jgi:nucleoid-associated protein YgaU
MFPRVIMVVFVALAIWGAFARGSGASGHGHAYVVKPGDTLWSIAAGSYGGDTRRGVWELERANGLGDDAAIASGERLRLPW